MNLKRIHSILKKNENLVYSSSSSVHLKIEYFKRINQKSKIYFLKQFKLLVKMNENEIRNNYYGIFEKLSFRISNPILYSYFDLFKYST